jgi:hypothetical protein
MKKEEEMSEEETNISNIFARHAPLPLRKMVILRMTPST